MLIEYKQLSIKECARRLNANYPHFVKIVRKFEEDGFLTREEQIRYRKTHILKLTEKGKKVSVILRKFKKIGDQKK